MGRRSRKRTGPSSPPPSPPAQVDATPSRARSRSRRDAAPEAPWGSFPLVELCVLAAIVLAVGGFVVGGRAGNVLLVGAVLMGSVAGLEVALREHLGGFRSHTLVLSGTLAAATLAVSVVADVGRATILPIAVAVFVVACLGFRALFKQRSGGFGMRVR